MHYDNGVPVDFTYLEVNDQFEKLTGLHDVIGKRVTELIPGIKETNPELFEIYGRVAQSGVSESFEVYLKTLDLWFRVSAYSIEKNHFVAVFENITEQKRSEQNIKKLVKDLQKAQVYAQMGSWGWDLKTNRVDWSDGMYKVFGVEKGSIVPDMDDIIVNHIYPDDIERVRESNKRIIQNKQLEQVEYRIVRPDRSIRTLWSEAGELILNDNGIPEYLYGYVVDITQRKQIEFEQNTTIKFLKMVNDCSNMTELLERITGFFHYETRCEAVGVRLKKDNDYPYYVTRGFPAEFVLAENSLCQRDDEGNIIRDADFNPVFECMCGNVICGRFDPAKKFFSPNGSFWSNSTTELLRTTKETDRLTRTRNRCNGEGYESVALIPLVSDKVHLGLLQLNDKRTNMFSSELIAMWERLAGYLAVAIKKFEVEENLKKNLKEKSSLLVEIHHRVKNNLQIVSSLLKLQQRTVDDPSCRRIIDESCSRIYSMSLIHEILYNSSDFTDISVKDYLKRLIGHIIKNYNITGKEIGTEINVTNIRLSLNKMIPLGLLLNELITNSLKHAFSNTEKPVIHITINNKSDMLYELCYSDNGKGIGEVQDKNNFSTLGMSLITSLSEQIGSKGKFITGHGTVFKTDIVMDE